MSMEVEVKYRLADAQRFREQMEELGAAPDEPLEQCDTYFGHPVRDFGETDEALRVRRTGQEVRVTYKGPKLDQETKTREEIEIPFDPSHTDAERDFSTILKTLGFHAVREVRKRRTPFHLNWDSHQIELSIDEVDGLGFFCELETIADESELESAKHSILKLAQHLELKDTERRSYLGLLLEQDGSKQGVEN